MWCMEKVIGCLDDMIILCGVNVFLIQIEEQILKCFGLVLYFQIELIKDNCFDKMMVYVEVMLDVVDSIVWKVLVGEFVYYIKSVVGIFVEIDVIELGVVEWFMGKVKWVVDNCGV